MSDKNEHCFFLVETRVSNKTLAFIIAFFPWIFAVPWRPGEYRLSKQSTGKHFLRTSIHTVKKHIRRKQIKSMVREPKGIFL